MDVQNYTTEHRKGQHLLVGSDPAIGEGRATQKAAVLVLTAVLADQLP